MEWTINKEYSLVFNTYGVEKVRIEEIDNSIAPIFKKSMIESYSAKFPGEIKYYTNINNP